MSIVIKQVINSGDIPLSSKLRVKSEYRELVLNLARVVKDGEAVEIGYNGKKPSAVHTGISVWARKLNVPVRCVTRSNRLFVVKS